MSTELVPTNGNSAVTITPDQVELVRRTVAKGATEDELQLYFFDCQRQGVHPLDKLLHFTKRGGRYTPITSIDFMRSRADATGEYAGNDDPKFEEGGGLGTYPKKATVTVWKMVAGQRAPFSATARWNEYYPGDGGEGFMWRKMPHVMLGKVAEALALRKAFPRQLAGLYASEEMDQAGQESRAVQVPKIPPRKAVPDVADALPPIEDDGVSEHPEELAPGDEPISRQTRTAVFAMLKEVNKAKGDGVAQAYVAENYGKISLSAYSEKDAQTLLDGLRGLL